LHECSEYAAVFQIAVDAVTRNTLADDVYAFESHCADQGGVVFPVLRSTVSMSLL